ncbi:MAG TPA: SMP-30/gluconolactonase/LRE family protein [Bacteroidetes bacterium]|nr:SMP-30/gluconolactonase/LRE family protein [Bacteroidota bacterium]
MKTIFLPKNRLYWKIVTINCLLAISFPAFAQNDLSGIIADGATLELLSGEFSFTEGPAADRDGNVYFTDQPNDRIMVWTTEGDLEIFLQPSGRSNGLFIDKNGYLWACADENNEIWKISPTKQIEKTPNTFEGARFNGPNDLWVSPNGKVYFTDPFFRRDWWSHTSAPQEKRRVYMYDPEKGSIIGVEDSLTQPNGIVGTPDGKKLFVADNAGSKTWSFTIEPDGSLSNKTLFCNMSSDGITIDTDGNLYLTGRGVTIFDKTGKRLGNIPVPESWTANVCFGDSDRQSLYITASKGLYRIKMKVKGAY